MGVPVYENDIEPTWQMTTGATIKNASRYQKVYSGQAFAYPTQCPKLEYRCFVPPENTGHVVQIYQRIAAK